MDEHASYIKNLKFNPQLEKSWIASYLKNPRLLILILILIFALGIYSFLNLPRRLNPEIKIPIVIISTVLPGASPNDVESLLTIPIEDAVTGVSGVKTIQSTSRDSISIVQIEFESGTDPDKAQSDTKSAVDTITDFPSDAQDPQVRKLDFERQPVWSFALYSNTNDNASLIGVAKDLKTQIKDLQSVEEVEISGLETQEIQVLIKPEAISTYKINPQQLSQIIATATRSFPAGNIRTDNSSFSLAIDPVISDVESIRNLKVDLNGSIVNLSDIAVISDRSKPEQKQAFLATKTEDGRVAVTFNVYRTSSVNINKAAEDARIKTDEILKEYPNQFTLLSIRDTAHLIDDQFNELVKDLAITVSLVFIVLFIFLGSRQAIVASLSIPLTFLITFTAMYLTGIALSFIAFFSLLLALGLLVDDTIVVISAMTSYFRAGKFTPLETGLLVWRDFLIAIFTTTITTVWAFVPLLLSSGIIGEFIKPIPIVVSATLLASFFIAMFVTLPVMVLILKPQFPRRVIILVRVLMLLIAVGLFAYLLPKDNFLLISLLVFLILIFVAFQTIPLIWGRLSQRFKKTKKPLFLERVKWKNTINHGLISFEKLSISYQGFIKRVLSSPSLIKKVIVMVVIFSVFSYLLLPLGFVKNEFFPKTDEDEIFISLELPSGTNIDKSSEQALLILNQVRQTESVRFATATVGQGFSPDVGISAGENNNVLINIVLEEKRQKSSSEIAELLRNQYKDYQIGKLSVIEQSGGPPAGADLQIKLSGNDLNELDKYGDQIVDFLSKQQGITTVSKSIKPGTSKLKFTPDQEKIAANNLTIDQVGFWLRFFASGFKADSLRIEEDGNEEKEINLRLSDLTQYSENLSTLSIPSANGDIPISSLGKLTLEPNPTLITREDGKRTLSVSAGVSPGVQVSEKSSELEKFAESIKLPGGYSWKTGGVNEENQNSVNSIMAAMGLSFMLIIITMVLQFASFRKALIVMLVIPLSISGVFIIFALSNTPLSFPALIGVLALFGIVVKNSILVVDKIDANEKSGMEFKEAIAEGSASRLEAIALTSICAIIGLIPITLSDPLWRGLGGAIIAGLTFSGTIMLFFIPLIYYLWFKPAKVIKSSSRLS